MQRWNRRHFLVFLCASVVHLIMIEIVATIPRLSVSWFGCRACST